MNRFLVAGSRCAEQTGHWKLRAAVSMKRFGSLRSTALRPMTSMMAADKTSKPGGAQPKRHSEVSVVPQRVGQFFDGEVAMDLELASGQTIRGAEEGDLAYIEGEDFAILSDGSLFIQCAVKQGSPNRYFIEYQDGSKDKHYQAVDEQIALYRVLSAFRKYLGRDPSWRTDFQWEKLDLEASSTAHSAMAGQTVGVLAGHHPSDVGQIRRMPAVIAEFPSEEFHTSLQAIEAAFERIRAKEYAGRTILLSGQSYEAGGERYRMIDVLYEDGTFKFKHPVADIELVARFARIPPERVTVLENGRAVTIQMGSPSELTRFLDRLYRASFSIRLLPGKDSYNFVSEVIDRRD